MSQPSSSVLSLDLRRLASTYWLPFVTSSEYFHKDQGFLDYETNPCFAGVMLDDTDCFWGMGAGPDFHTIPEGHTNAQVGYMVLITSPLQAFNLNPSSRGVPELYTDTKVYSKTARTGGQFFLPCETEARLANLLEVSRLGARAILFPGDLSNTVAVKKFQDRRP